MFLKKLFCTDEFPKVKSRGSLGFSRNEIFTSAENFVNIEEDKKESLLTRVRSFRLDLSNREESKRIILRRSFKNTGSTNYY